MLVALIAALVAAPASAGAPGPQPVQLSLGDSLAAGVGAGDPDSEGYVAQFHDYLTNTLDPNTKLVNLGISGATADDLANDKHPLKKAVKTLQHRNVEVVTIDIGGNDLFGAVTDPASGCLPDPSTPECQAAIGQTLADIGADLTVILGSLRAADPDVQIIVMLYHNTIANPEACALAGLAPFADAVLLPAFNGVIAGVAGAFGADLATPAVDVANLVDCLHPNAAGYSQIRDAFIDAYEG